MRTYLLDLLTSLENVLSFEVQDSDIIDTAKILLVHAFQLGMQLANSKEPEHILRAKLVNCGNRMKNILIGEASKDTIDTALKYIDFAFKLGIKKVFDEKVEQLVR